MFSPRGRGYCLLKEAVNEDFQTLSVECGKFRVRVGAELWLSNFARFKSSISQIFEEVCFTISKDLLSSSRLCWSNSWGL